MYIIDKKFKTLTSIFNTLSLEEIYENIKEKYLIIPDATKDSLEKFLDEFPYWGRLKRYENDYEELYNRAISLKNHVDDYITLYNSLCDYRSKKLLYSILSNWYQFDFNSIEESFEKNFSHYFDLDIVKCDKNEVVVDAGAFIGDTVIDYINNYGIQNYKKIYCYDITQSNIEALKINLKNYPNIICYNKALSNNQEPLYISQNSISTSANMVSQNGSEKIESSTLDIDIKEPITLIKMDIEGYEKKALEGSKNHIINEKPKLLISVYHNHEDLWKIPKIIREYNKDYKFYLRCYGTRIFPTEIVLIAI